MGEIAPSGRRRWRWPVWLVLALALGGLTTATATVVGTRFYWAALDNALELALWMESDRMGYLLPALTDAKFENQRDVVLNERRQQYELQPFRSDRCHSRR